MPVHWRNAPLPPDAARPRRPDEPNPQDAAARPNPYADLDPCVDLSVDLSSEFRAPGDGWRVEKAGGSCISWTFVAFGILEWVPPPARGIWLPFRCLLKTRVGLGSFGFFDLASTEVGALYQGRSFV